MIKTSILTLMVVLVVGVAAMAVRSSSSAQAQATGARRWEYCAITSISYRFHSEADRKYEPFAEITYYGTAGSRSEELVGEPVDDVNAVNAVRDAAGKAIAKLGADGWEVVGNENFNLAFNPETVKGLLFKRPR
jgi:hypothetical protein